MTRKLYFSLITFMIINQLNSQSIVSNSKIATTIQKGLATYNFQVDSSAEIATELYTLNYSDEEISASKDNFEYKRDLPFRGIENIASSFTGISKLDNSSLLNLRGGLSSQTKISVDGMFVNNPYNNSVNNLNNTFT